MIKRLVFLGVLGLTGCASTVHYAEPQTTGQETPATIIGFADTKDHVFICHLKAANVERIDDLKVKYPMSANYYEYAIKVLPGKHDFVIDNSFITGCSSGKKGGLTEFDAVLKPGVHYKLANKLDEQHVQSWLEDEKGNRVSDVATTPIEAQAPETIFTLLADN
ncbi:MAG: hypothetical protein K0S08_1403 [Gammaproteobacteria bacterium]|jgi:hypothetical protein|nr:hypothetical protein [Gammaproteobacteria bacterium]